MPSRPTSTLSISGLIMTRLCAAFLFIVLLFPAFAAAGPGGTALPNVEELWRVLTLRDYNTRVVVAGTTFLGIASGLVGSFLLLRKRSLLSDAISHATLPGICIAFIALQIITGNGKSLPGLLAGAALTGTLGMATVLAISRYSRLKDDAALGIVLSVFFGAGVCLMTIAGRVEGGNAAGLQSFIYGKTASMLLWDAQLITITAFCAAVVSVVLFKEFTIVCFDTDFANVQGWPAGILDFLMMSLVVVVTVIGLQAVGLILVVAMLIIPPAAARFWTYNLRIMLILAAAIGGISGFIGSALSALMGSLPAGAIIVLVTAAFFGLSMIFGSSRGLVTQWLRHVRLTHRVGRQHVLRAIYEVAEELNSDDPRSTVPIAELAGKRSWSARRLRARLRRAAREDLVQFETETSVSLTERGLVHARRVIRNHRLWEMYLITHADIAPSHVDRDADMIEHVLDAPMIEKLEGLLLYGSEEPAYVPQSPH